jgi:hypothetical protein
MQEQVEMMVDVLKGLAETTEYADTTAKIYKQLYVSLLSEGFSRTDAMKIICNMKLS